MKQLGNGKIIAINSREYTEKKDRQTKFVCKQYFNYNMFQLIYVLFAYMYNNTFGSEPQTLKFLGYIGNNCQYVKICLSGFVSN